uniref:Hsp70 family protein n=1 Tax=Panagrolaimus davidi TaxID=227884 RepID=A0A914PNT9_9BILA
MKIKYETALKCAAQLASLKVIEFIDAPTAVLIDYIFTYKKLTTVNFNICVIDIGGGTTDIVAYNVESNGREFRLKPLFKYENSKFNGRNFDIAFAEKINSIIVKKHERPVNIGNNFSLLSRAEKMKIELSNETSAKYLYIQDREEQSVSINRKDFENCVQPFIESFKKELTNINQKFEENGQNNEVLLLGSTCKIPIVSKTIKDIFSNSNIIEAFHYGISFAKGAAIHTAKIQQSNDNQISVYKY